jgi:hypothetical protein
MVKAFGCLEGIPGKTVGVGAVICMAKERLPLTENVWILPVRYV